MASCCFCERSRESTSMASSRSFSLKYLRTKTIATGNPNTASTLTMGMSAWIISDDMAAVNVADRRPFRACASPRNEKGAAERIRRPLGHSNYTGLILAGLRRWPAKSPRPRRASPAARPRAASPRPHHAAPAGRRAAPCARPGAPFARRDRRAPLLARSTAPQSTATRSSSFVPPCGFESLQGETHPGSARVKDLSRRDLVGGSAQMSALVRPGQVRQEPPVTLRVAGEGERRLGGEEVEVRAQGALRLDQRLRLVGQRSALFRGAAARGHGGGR